MLPRVLEPEVMDSAAEACDYDAMDHAAVNRVFVDDFLAQALQQRGRGPFSGEERLASSLLDVGAGTAQIPIELCRRDASFRVIAIDLAEHMLRVGTENLRRAGLSERIRLERVDAKHMPYAD